MPFTARQAAALQPEEWHKCLYDYQPKGLKQAVDAMGLVWQGTYLLAMDDARSVASIVKEMIA